MSLCVHVTGDDEFSFVLDEAIADIWRLQMQRLDEQSLRVGAHERFAICLSASLLQCVDGDLLPPTPSQVAYAADICREIAVSLPFEALRYRGEMSAFIRRYVPVFYQRRHRTDGFAPEPGD
jgi:hypothetical protein